MQERGLVAALSTPTKHPTPERQAPRWRLRVLSATVAVIVVAGDQITKSLAVAHLPGHPFHLFASFYLLLQYNSGTAFSLFQGFGLWIVVVGIVLVGALLAVSRWVRTKVGAVGIGMLLGGAVGNLADRLFRANHGAVIDFIYARYWPTFNVADACIVIGAVLLILSSWHRRTA